MPEQYVPYFQDVAIFLLELENVRRKVENGEWERYSVEEMKSLNEILYSDILEEHYGGSYANPIYAVEKFGLEMGRLLSMLYVEMRSGIPYSFENRVDYLTILFELLIEVYNSFESDTLPEPREIRDIFTGMQVITAMCSWQTGSWNRLTRFTHSLRISSRMPILKMTDISTDSANILRRMRWGQQDTCVRSRRKRSGKWRMCTQKDIVSDL